MPHVSKIHLAKKAEEKLLENLNSVLARINKGNEMIEFLNALLTHTEKVMLAKRLAIIVLLEERLTDSQIADILHVTRITVAKMRYFYESRGSGYKIALKKLNEEKRKEEFKNLLISLARYSIRAAGGRVKPSIFD